MKKIFLLNLVSAIVFSANSQNLTRFYQNSKVGYKDPVTSAVIVQPVYTAGSEFKDGVALVLEGNKRGFINANGEVIIPFMYDDASLFFEGLAKVRKGFYGFIDMKNQMIIPFHYEFADDFVNGLARVKKNGKFGFINKEGMPVIPFTYDNAYNFSEGLAPVQMNGAWGYIDALGKNIIPFKYTMAYVFKDGTAMVFEGDKKYIIDKNGKWVKDVEDFEEHERKKE
jgi:hypothetical protein